MARKPPATHATRALEARRIRYRVVEYDANAAFHSADEAAALLGVDANTVYKTLVVLRDQARARPILVMAPAGRQLDLKRLAAELGEKRLRMATQREAEALTGMEAGGISALALQKPNFDVFIDAAALVLAEVHVSAGRRGLDLALAPSDLIRMTGARTINSSSLD
jgi:Cys-tRNA(Pro)/Cys-tRNA(Cys) deacylase